MCSVLEHAVEQRKRRPALASAASRHFAVWRVLCIDNQSNMTTVTLDPTRSVAALVLDHSECAEVFQRHRIDFCCAGKVSIEAAATRRGVEVAALLEELRQAIAGRGERYPVDLRMLTTPALVVHIVSIHHEYLRRALPLVTGWALKLSAVHGAREPKLRALNDAVRELAQSLLAHLDEEERTVFPVLTADAVPDAEAARALEAMGSDHLTVATLLERIRDNTNDFRAPTGACNTHQTLFAELREIETDVLTHIHLENHVLAPRFALASA
jgi:regulator of cell morphogenesis and NO signaling